MPRGTLLQGIEVRNQQTEESVADVRKAQKKFEGDVIRVVAQRIPGKVPHCHARNHNTVGKRNSRLYYFIKFGRQSRAEWLGEKEHCRLSKRTTGYHLHQYRSDP